MSSDVSNSLQKWVRLPPNSGLTDLKPVSIYDVTKFPDTRTQKLRSLLEQGHVTVAPLRDPELILHSHLPHICSLPWISMIELLGSAYALGASSDNLTRTYDHEVTQLVPIARIFIRGTAISKENWRHFLTCKEYTVTYVKENRGYLGKVLEEYLYSGEAPLVNGYTGGLGHPFIHLAYAYEFRSEEYKTGFLAVVFESVRQDPRLDGLFREPGINNIDLLSQEQNLAVVLEKWNAWEVINPLAQLEESCDLAVLLALSNGNPRDSFDFFNVHIMTVAYALRVLWHYFPTSRRVSILEQYALFGIMTYICQLRPQMVRTPKVFEETFGRRNDFYLNGAIKFVTEFHGWEGYGHGAAGFIPSRDGYRPK
ncbi:questin oxidase family protein [Aspergillus niger CBS 101883]|uniref:questin oxidase family protein n=1 Tax=Aspergillus lacticoffeatus (strain CBS 101883) TaxID=1450533 RepID=UPI000D7F67EC|nr:uncharacterized protein BO96DRAFT_492644 [Aspergillus niger CBS 101883]PYH50237.1 hypothetical protein BO96DRAFT_492644 [Aspergillus niger CBS 101883]